MFKLLKIQNKKDVLLKKQKKPKKIGIEEPIRKTMYDVVVENLKVAERKTFLHRVIYIGNHIFSRTDDLGMEFFSSSVDNINALGVIEPITGLYLQYSKHFIHLVEADEDSIVKHLQYLAIKNKRFQYIYNVKILVDLCHISKRLTTEWTSHIGVPKKLINAPVHTESETMDDIYRQIYNVVTKIYQLIDKINGSNISIIDQEESKFDFDNPHATSGGSLETAKRFSRASSIALSILSFECDSQLARYRNFLPEYEVMDYLITSTCILNLIDYLSIWGNSSPTVIYNDLVWPVPSDMVPYDVFEDTYVKKYEMPKPVEAVTKSKRIEGEFIDKDEEDKEEYDEDDDEDDDEEY